MLDKDTKWFKVFSESRWCLNSFLKLELTLIELVKLKNIAKSVVLESANSRSISGLDRYHPTTETTCRFMVLEYGVVMNSDYQICVPPAVSGYYDPEASEIVNWLQNELHYP